VRMPDLLGKVDGSILLVSKLDAWEEMIQDSSSALWGAARAQAAYLLSIARGISLEESLRTVVASSLIPQGDQT